jgi:two-component system, NtrC family, response regulator HydG
MSKRILIVDDDRDHAESLADILDARGHRVELAHSGEAALARFCDTDFDLTLMDVRLPGMSGVETFFEFRRVRPGAQVLLMTGYSLEHLVAQAVENGALGVLRKPFSTEDLLSAIDDVKPRGLVLVADDDPLFTSSIVPVLTAEGYRVETAATGEEALRKLSGCRVDCLLLDLRMPVLSGLELYLQLKRAGRLVPTILVTAYAAEEEAQKLRLMTQGLLVKPFDPAVLLRRIAALGAEAAEGSPPTRQPEAAS